MTKFVDYTIGLKKGDLIGVNYPSGLWPAIFKGYGSNSNPQFWLLIENRLTEYKKRDKAPYTDYIVRDKFGNIAKLDMSAVDRNTIDLYNRYCSYLLDKGLL